MILVTVGNHFQQFNRLIKRIEEISKFIDEKIVIQIGHSTHIPKKGENKNLEIFRFSDSLELYIKRSRLIISHGGVGTTLEVLKFYKKPLIIIPRRAEFDEHINNHQVDFGKTLEKKGVKVIYNTKDLTPELIKSYNKKVPISDDGLNNLRNFLKTEIERALGV